MIKKEHVEIIGSHDGEKIVLGQNLSIGILCMLQKKKKRKRKLYAVLINKLKDIEYLLPTLLTLLTKVKVMVSWIIKQIFRVKLNLTMLRLQ